MRLIEHKNNGFEAGSNRITFWRKQKNTTLMIKAVSQLSVRFNCGGTIFFELNVDANLTIIRIKGASSTNYHRRILSPTFRTSVSALAGAIVRQLHDGVIKRRSNTLAPIAQQLPPSIVVGVLPTRSRANGLGKDRQS